MAAAAFHQALRAQPRGRYWAHPTESPLNNRGGRDPPQAGGAGEGSQGPTGPVITSGMTRSGTTNDVSNDRNKNEYKRAKYAKPTWEFLPVLKHHEHILSLFHNCFPQYGWENFWTEGKDQHLKKKKKRFPSRVLEIYNIWECSWFKKIAVVFPSWKKSTTMPRLQWVLLVWTRVGNKPAT